MKQAKNFMQFLIEEDMVQGHVIKSGGRYQVEAPGGGKTAMMSVEDFEKLVKKLGLVHASAHRDLVDTIVHSMGSQSSVPCMIPSSKVKELTH